MEFQIYDYIEDNEIITNDDSSSEDSSSIPKYVIHIFGRTLDDKSVYCKLTDYTPHFYIKLPEKWTDKEAKTKIKKMLFWFKSSDNKKVYNKFRSGLRAIDLVSKKDAIGFTNGKVFNFARMVFDNTLSMQKFKYMLENNEIRIPQVVNKEKKFNTYESNFLSMLRCFHIRDIKGCSWVEVKDYTQIEDDEKESHCDIEIYTSWKNITAIEKDCNAPFRIASFDIECTSIDGQFPQARRKGDKVIQIGTTYTKIGTSEPYRQHIVCLDETDDVNGVVTEWYNNERDMILAWKDEILKSDCDILTGYNIFFFDEKYIFDRCNLHLGIKYEMSFLSKLKNRECNFRDFKLASSALGENELRYWDTPGRVHIDLMKDVQKTYNLSSYKLDLVASHFIRSKILKAEREDHKGKYLYKLHCSNINDIQINDFIHIEHVKSFVSDFIGKKYNIEAINSEEKILTIITDVLIPEIDEGDLFWSQAKDDITPQDIFNSQKGTSQDRSIIAKYCVKDCKLVGLLMNKLEVVTKNIEMANVCYVPLSYLFYRGQGIKLFSKVLVEYRQEGYLFPTLKKPDGQDSGYEGAIVFDPIPNVYYEALATKDYASLYPSSIIHKNMSHETILMNSNYDNLDGVEYYNARYKQNDGTNKYVRFAKTNGELGVIPKTLDKILKERKAVKKKMKIEKDPFKYKILDAKQLALKITANSLYGQLGAPTSQIFLKQIAACTTSTGREMLVFAKKYDEEILPGFINGLKHAYKSDDKKMIEKLYQLELKDPNDEKLKTHIEKFVKNDIKELTLQPVIRYGDTDSVFTCFRFKENCNKIKKESALVLWNEIIQFSRILIEFFIEDDYKDLWTETHQMYYNEQLVTKLELPASPAVLPTPQHWNDLLPIKERMKIFLKEYMEESYLPWLWTLQELFLTYKEKLDMNTFQEILLVKLYKMGEEQIDKIRINCVEYHTEEHESESEKELLKEKKEKLEETLNKFIVEKLKTTIIEPYWTFKKTKKIKVKLWKSGTSIIDKRSLELTMELGKISGDTVKKRLPFPHDLEYEKTYWPYLILTKKRYVGNKYEFDHDDHYLDYMGIVLKRRDNSPIVKEICNGIIDELINNKNPEQAKIYTQKCLENMYEGKYDINYFLTSKTLKSKESYKDWTRIAHVVLAERISIRDPGNKPQSGDRIEYAAIKVDKNKDTLQGDMIEIPQYIKEGNLELDYLFYITNQIMKPALQFLNLAVNSAEDIFNPYIFRGKIEDLLKEKKSLVENNCKIKKENINIKDFDIDYHNMSYEELPDIIDNLKKDIRKARSEGKKLLAV